MTDFLSPHSLKLAEHAKTTYHVTVPPHVDFDMAMGPTFWRNVQSRLRIGDQIRITTADNAWMADVIVAGISGVGARMVELPGFPIRLDGPWKQAADSGHYYVNFLPKEGQYGVVRHQDSTVVHMRDTEADATRWAKDTGLTLVPLKDWPKFRAKLAAEQTEGAAA